ncbi:hypothetical protein Goari_019826, partial [Gossypium aridum]|nr:hypothetical protein [Gossypium aridum]
LEKTQQEKDDSLTEGYTSELWDFIRISVTQNNLQELKEMWDNGMTKPSSYSTKTMVICLIYSMSKWISTYFELLPSIGISPIAASLLESIYGLVIFPKALGHIDDVVLDLFDRLDKMVTPAPIILAKTFRSLSAYRRVGEERFI